jgi:hypothetical protein
VFAGVGDLRERSDATGASRDLALLLIQKTEALGLSRRKKIDPETVVELGAAYEFVNNDNPDWQTYYFSVNHKFSTGQVLYGTASAVKRFQTTDPNFMIGFVQPLSESKRWIATFEAATSPNHQILPITSFFGQVERSLQQRLGRSCSAAEQPVSNRHCEHGHLWRRKIFQGLPRSVQFVCRTFKWKGHGAQSRVSGKLLLR